MKKLLFVVALITSVVACTKDHTPDPVNVPDTTGYIPKRTFFHTKDAAFEQVKKLVELYSPERELISIKSIAYTQSLNKTYAMIFYLTDKGMDNLVIMKAFDGDKVIEAQSLKCDNGSCDCKVGTTVSSDGSVKVSCSCPSCDMIIHGLEDF